MPAGHDHFSAVAPTTEQPTLVALPGTGSDADYARRAFAAAATALGAHLVTPQPSDDLIAGHLSALDAAAHGRTNIVVGGVSIGAAIALRWACARAHDDARCIGVLAALPPWTGSPDGAPAAASASVTADNLQRLGVDATIDAMVRSSPAWLASELTRSWRALGPGLERQLRTAATFRCPDLEEMATLRVRLGIVAAVDDPIHPIGVAREWRDAAPRSVLREITLDEWGHDPGRLGREAAAAFLEA